VREVITARADKIVPLVVAALAVCFVAVAAYVATSRPDADTPSAYVTSADRYEYGVASILGDSYSAGSGAAQRNNGYVRVLAQRLCLRNTMEDGPGTGYVNPGSEGLGNFGNPDRIAHITRDAPDLVIVQGGIADAGNTDVEPAALSVFDRIKAGAPSARVVVIGPTLPPALDSDAIVAVRDQIRTAAGQAGVTFLDPIDQAWITDPTLYAKDGINLTSEGHRIFGKNITESVSSLLPRNYCEAVS
jgi:lysophospholipase L1-like esterase